MTEQAKKNITRYCPFKKRMGTVHTGTHRHVTVWEPKRHEMHFVPSSAAWTNQL
jgi:hypothetical protein